MQTNEALIYVGEGVERGKKCSDTPRMTENKGSRMETRLAMEWQEEWKDILEISEKERSR